MVSSTSRGDKLEDAFHRYLIDQKDRGELVFGAYPPQNCKIHKKKAYYCREREAYVEFDVVIELYRTSSDTPHLYVIFECKNHEASVSEIYVNDFSSKIGRIFPHASKGVIVVTSRLQSGAATVAKNGGMGIVKYDERGLEIVADRRGSYLEYGFVRAQIFRGHKLTKSLKFSGFHDGKYFASVGDFLANLDPEATELPRHDLEPCGRSVPFLSLEQIKAAASKVLESTGYTTGIVDLSKICRSLFIDLHFSDHDNMDADGKPILGSANFGRKTIEINSHSIETRERFTIAHEIGHFVLDHEQYLRSETIIERDLFITADKTISFNYERLEYQANAFAAELILPDAVFLRKTAQFRRDLEITDRGHGYVFVDDQPYNLLIYNELLSRLSNYFAVSKQAIEVKLKKSKMLTDRRKGDEILSLADLIGNSTLFQRR